MQITALSDIHGNFPALPAAITKIEDWRSDLVIVAGDIINGGPLNHACLPIVKRKQESSSRQVLRGNHEDYVIEWASPRIALVY